MPEEFNTKYSEEIARQNFLNEVVIINAQKPFTWASGTKNPIYVDHRLNQGIPKTRDMTKQALLEIIRKKNLKFDAILGTSTGGLSWGAIIARELQIPFLLIEGGEIYEFQLGSAVEKISAEYGAEETITANVPFGIPVAACVADKLGIPLMFIRPEPKTHGKEKQIEGLVENPPFSTTGILNIYEDGNNYIPRMHECLRYNHIRLNRQREYKVEDFATVVDISGKKILFDEDLISTGASYLKELDIVRNHEGIVTDIISLFHYELPEAIEKAENAGVKIHPVLTYKQTLGVGIENGYIQQEDEAMLAEWIATQPFWGEKYFPSANRLQKDSDTRTGM